jgi:hypothetical protein
VNARGRARKPGAPKSIRDDEHQQFTAWPRPVREIRDELCSLAASPPVSPMRLDDLANELAWAAAIAAAYGGNTDATDRLERAVRETAELARITASRRQAVAA